MVSLRFLCFFGFVLGVLLKVNCEQEKQYTALKAELVQIIQENNLKSLLEEVIIKSFEANRCIVIIAGPPYNELFKKSWFQRFKLFISYITIYVKESEDLLSPTPVIQESLIRAKNEGCQLYLILLANGLQTGRLLKFGDRYRFIDTRANYVILYDKRLFTENLFYIWKRIINVIFLKEYASAEGVTRRGNTPWYEITTVPFPSPIGNILVPRRLDIWTNRTGFRKSANLFKDKTYDLRNQTLKVVAFAHLPGTTKSNQTIKGVRAQMSAGQFVFSGTEVEILNAVAKTMNFKCEIYEPYNADVELWGRKLPSGLYTGIISEMVTNKADVALGDLYYTPYLLDLMDLSIPYNTECLTFLTPESLTDNSWKTLILPFSGIMWASVIICLVICCIVFHTLARFHEQINKIKERNFLRQRNKRKKITTIQLHSEKGNKLNANMKYTLMKEEYEPIREEGEPIGLYQFSEPVNSVLYTYSMLLLVSLPKLPTGWSLRMLTGWYWLYCLLLVVAYRASMTAILSRPTPRVTIDTLQELIDSRLTCGGWGEINRQFFKLSLDKASKVIGENFETVNNSADAVDRVAAASFAFYENTYFLKEALVKRQLRYQNLRTNTNQTNDTQTVDTELAQSDRSLHIMRDCIINMPTSIGYQKNSPIKPRIDKIIRRVIEAGLIQKWLNDVMQSVLTAKGQLDYEGIKALMNMKKFVGALVALFIGYFLGIVLLVVEIVYFYYKVRKNPQFNKYSKVIHKGKKSA